MKSTLLVLLALACTSFAAILERHERDADEIKAKMEAFKTSCPGMCFQQQKYKDHFGRAAPKVKAWYEQTSAGSGAPAIPDVSEEKWNEYCTEFDSLKTCVDACNAPDDAERKTKVLSVLAAGKDLVCDSTIKTKFNCLKQFASIPSPSCNTQCEQYKNAVVTAGTAYGQRPPGSPIDFEKLKAAGTAACQLVHCRLTCRKPEIVEKCGQDGFDAAKHVVQKLGAFAQTIHSQFRPAANFPEACTPAKLIEGA